MCLDSCVNRDRTCIAAFFFLSLRACYSEGQTLHSLLTRKCVILVHDDLVAKLILCGHLRCSRHIAKHFLGSSGWLPTGPSQKIHKDPKIFMEKFFLSFT